MKKTLLIAVAVVAALVGGLVVFVFRATGPVVEAADRFLSLLGEGKTHEAYLSASKALRDRQDEGAFERSAKDLGLDGYESSSWSSREVSNDSGKVEGTVKTRSGSERELAIHLAREEGEWRVVSFGRAGSTPAAPIPPKEELERMASASVGSFADAVRAKDFTRFHQTLATIFRDQTSPESLASVFRQFLEQNMDLGGVKDVTPIFNKPPATNDDGQLVLAGSFPTKPLTVTFDLKYAYEHPDWKLVGIEVHAKP